MELTISEAALLISFLSMVATLIFNIKSSKKSDTKDVQKEAEEKAETKIMLKQISEDVSEMKSNFSSIREDVKGLTERMVIVEHSLKSAHKRLDSLAGNKQEV